MREIGEIGEDEESWRRRKMRCLALVLVSKVVREKRIRNQIESGQRKTIAIINRTLGDKPSKLMWRAPREVQYGDVL